MGAPLPWELDRLERAGTRFLMKRLSLPESEAVELVGSILGCCLDLDEDENQIIRDRSGREVARLPWAEVHRALLPGAK